MENYDVIIIGGGAAGSQSALYTARANIKTLLLYTDDSSLLKAERIENYYGVPPVDGKTLYRRGIRAAKAAGATTLKAEAVAVRADGNFVVKTKRGEFSSTAVIIATGRARKTPNIAGLKELEGKGVSYCAVCDGFFYRKKTVAVVGAGAYALEEYNHLKAVTQGVTLLTNGEAAPENFDGSANTGVIAAVEGTNRVESVRFQDGSSLAVDGVFVAIGSMDSSAIAKTVGLTQDEAGNLKTDENLQTIVSGIFAAGDCIKGTKQIAKAACDGMTAAMSAIQYVRAKAAAQKSANH